MNDLLEAQRLMWQALRWPTGVKDFLDQADPDTRARFHATFDGDEHFGAVERVDVYANAYFGRLAGVLGDAFEVTRWLVGETHFHNLCTDYVLHRPSVDPDLRHFGSRFAEFLAAHELARSYPAAVDMARVEWARIDLLDAADFEPLARARLAELPPAQWPALVLTPSPAASLLETSWPCTALWKTHREAPREAAELPLAPVPGATLVWRRGFAVAHRPCDAVEAAALRGLFRGDTFSALCDAAAGAQRDRAGPGEVAGMVLRWVDEELVADVDVT